MHHYSDAHLRGLIPLDEAVDRLRAAFVAQADGHARIQPRIPTELDGFRLNTMAALDPVSGYAGAKVYTAWQRRFSFLVVLFAMDDGRLLGTFDAGELTRLRTSATTVLAAQHLARTEGSHRLVVFGTGTQADCHAVALCRALPITEVLVVGRDSASAFAAHVAHTTGVPARTSTAEEAVPLADVIVTATRSATPLFDGRLVPDGCFVAAVGSGRPDAAEIDATLLARSERIVVESIEQARHEAGDLLLAGSLEPSPWDKVSELGAVLSGRAPGRRNALEITLFESVGLALEDVAIASLAYEKLSSR